MSQTLGPEVLETHERTGDAINEDPLRPPGGWMKRLEALIRRLGLRDSERREYALANAQMIIRTVMGAGPDAAKPSEGAGARAVFNISSAHIPALCAESATSGDSRPYKNAYDLVHEYYQAPMPIGDAPPRVSNRREIVDSSLPLPSNSDGSDVYFGALELNGAGVRFYGDFCLVLTPTAVDIKTPVLDRNSYDLVRAPIYERILEGKRRSVFYRLSNAIDLSEEPSPKQKARIADEALILSGNWGDDRAPMAAIKVLETRAAGMRRLSTGQISDGVLDDEDYIEVLKLGSFGAAELQEVRVAAADVAADARIGERVRFGPAPSSAALLWRDRRRMAEQALARFGPSLRIVTSRGRMK